MTTLEARTLTTTTATPTTALRTGLSHALDELGEVAAQAGDDAPTRAALARAVEQLEQAAGADLGSTTCDPLVVLQRRLGRAAQRLDGLTAADASAAAGLSAEQVRAHAAALRCPVPVQRRSAGAPRPVGVLAGC